MKFDVIIIGSGLAGLTAGIRLAEAGKSCAIISNGQSALHFSSGSLDLLTHLPDGTPVSHPKQALSTLAQQAPEHPYSRIGEVNVTQLIEQAQTLLSTTRNLDYKGNGDENHYRITPVGRSRMSWMSPQRVPTYSVNQPFPWKKIAVVGIEGFLDFQPQFASSTLNEQGIEAIPYHIHLPLLDRLRDNPSEFRAINIARYLDKPENTQALAEELIKHIDNSVEAIVLPACIGLDEEAPVNLLQECVGKPICLLPTLPPSLLGIRLHQALKLRFQQAGGLIMPGDRAEEADLVGNKVVGIHTRNHTDIPIRSEHVVLATGSFFNNGLIAEFDRIYEPLMELDLLESLPRNEWTQVNVFAKQPYMRFGVNTDSQLRPLKYGEALDNVYAVGALLGGFDPLNEGCGAGVSMISALYAAQQILQSDKSQHTTSAAVEAIL
ncbi:glycerol-3-phosphate dehydrogenase subunit GlpB [Proteus mirabilis]|uniref:glycerol-3-phosphate dehydrogenase subunit GlpB n=1 Tax=Proteus mirabilis TaxID=584 RepID=UPI002025056D|nr:glycerol-3-phosphate dehydrogenase subunit GlpB [Proteus mirabilis]MCL8549571.1 glycerol-3-phosphate dehydrogenase subunit GlpB [Proteus mirabilis]MCL8564175.1 glycerol-3-phosphate dehydrogenase subunit GlpB [Proteus mirabilis]MCL8578743.1 glycerol-3-phosphate dehydrogenase subunit GlpB [Proteus mirabilis]